jgi:hypothetical protein
MVVAMRGNALTVAKQDTLSKTAPILPTMVTPITLVVIPTVLAKVVEIGKSTGETQCQVMDNLIQRL